jgi:hypothetical protein
MRALKAVVFSGILLLGASISGLTQEEVPEIEPAVMQDAGAIELSGEGGGRQDVPDKPAQPVPRHPSRTVAVGGGGGSSSAAGLKVYPDWKSVPDKFGGLNQVRVKYEGAGSGISIGFKASKDTGSFSWVEAPSPSVGECAYRAWYSSKPGGASVGAKCSGKTPWYGGMLQWAAGRPASKRRPCALKAGDAYYFNIQLVGGQSCSQFLAINF